MSALGYGPEPIVFDTPTKDEKGIMVLGNGEVGATAWLDAAGTLHTVLQNSDSWNEGGRHVKTGAIDYETKAPVDVGTYRQELSMARGEFEASWKSGGKPVSLRYRVQYGTDSIVVCEVKGAPKAEAKVVNWRLYPGGSKEFGVGEYELGIRFCEGYFVDNVKDLKFTISADRLVPGGWCHVNRNETVKELMKVYDYYQATGDFGKPDLLSDRVFGGVTRKIVGKTTSVRQQDGELAVVRLLSSDTPRILFLTAVTCLHPCKDEAEWLRRTNEMFDRDGWTLEGEEAKRAEHIAAWAKFWDRSHIVVSPAAGTAGKTHKGFAFQTNGKLPVSFGVNPKGGDKFVGTFAFAEVEFDGKVVYSGVPKVGDAVATGKMPGNHANGQDTRSPSSFRFACRFTTDNAARPQRLIDNITPGKSDGFLVDLLSGRVRMIVGKHTFTHRAKVPSRREVAVEAVVPKTGQVKIVVDGKCETFEAGVATVADACAAVTRAYAAQRYTAACAGQGRLPIRFNGSLFTTEEKGDPDYRRWGNGYWWQNTRLPYYPMFAAGDLDMLKPLFRMYLGFLDFNMKRTRKYLGHGGAYFPECVQPWGDHFIGSYGPECAWKDRKDKLQHHPCHKYEWVGQLEISLMLLDYQAYMQDTAWFRKNALPSIREYVLYFDEHYKLDERGRYHMYPAQAVETWQDCTNPMPEIAGLTRVTDLLLALPDDTLESGDRELFTKIRSRIPDLPTRRIGDDVIFAPGARFDRHRNVETPELYCVFPFRLCSFEKSNAAIGLRTYPVRFHKHYRGWAQDELNAAYLGLADEAAEHLANRVLHNSAGGFRWPAYWGPNFDWRPDQCAGGNIQNILQSMLMQYEGKKMFLLPAWPKDWNCDFKLHAPYNTTVEGHVENGEVKDLVVTPASRMKDVMIMRDNPGGESLLDLVAPVSSWDDGIPLGNGSAGALLWGGGDTLNVTLDRADFWHNILATCYDSPNFTWDMLVDTVTKKDDVRRSEIFDKGESATKLPGVRLVLKLGEGQSLLRFKLDGATASAAVTVATPYGDKDIVAWFDDGDTLLSMRIPDGVTFASKTFVKNPSFATLGGYPDPDISIDDGKAVYRRLRRKGAGNRFDRDFEAGVRFCSAGDAPRSAFWPKFNAESEVSIPDPKLQRLYDFVIYLYGAGARAGCAPLALQGLWTADNGKLPPWHGDYHNDLNTEMTYWAAGPAGRIEALEAFADFYIERLPEYQAFCRKIFKGGDGAVIPPTMGYAAQPILGWTAYTLPPIHGIWAFNTFCDAWDYDPTPEKAAKYLAFGRELAAGLEHSWKVVDGVRKLTLSCSPEVGNNSNNCFLNANSSYERAILDSFYVWLSRLAEACGNADEAAKWRAYVGTFGPPNVMKDGTLEISAGNPLKFSHRHPSHLMQVFPLTNVPREDGVDFVKSVEWWERLGTDWWVGFSFPWAGCFEARLGRGDRAYRYLKDFARAFTTRNGFNVNGDQLKCGLSRHTYRPFTLEANFGFARGIQEMLLSYDPNSDTYRLFPALPKEWDGKEVSFRNLRLPGGHRVSAKRAADGTVTHEISPNQRAKSVPRLAPATP